MAYAAAFATREAWLSPPTTPAGALAQKAGSARAEFISSTEPENAAHYAYAAEDANDIEYIAREFVSFWRRVAPRYAAMSYATKGFDADHEFACHVERLEEPMTAEAAAYFRAELANGEVA